MGIDVTELTKPTVKKLQTTYKHGARPSVSHVRLGPVQVLCFGSEVPSRRETGCF